MAFIGQLSLILALILAIYSIGANLYGVRRNLPELITSARHAVWAMCAMVALAMCALWAGLLHSDFSLEYVAVVHSSTLPTVYKVTALWGGQQGSLLLWTLLLSVFTAIVAFQNHRRNPEIASICAGGDGRGGGFLPGHAEFRHAAVRMLAAVPTEGRT